MSNTTATAALGVAWSTAKTLRGETVTYHRGSSNVELTAVFSRPQADQVDGEENITFESRDVNILIDPTWPSTAPAAFTNHQPSRGDKIEKADGTIYHVQPSDPAGPCWRWSDGQRTFRRVYAQEAA